MVFLQMKPVLNKVENLVVLFAFDVEPQLMIEHILFRFYEVFSGYRLPLKGASP